jgi:hypothetical protein
MRFTLVQYPAAIAQAAQAVNEIDHRIGELKQHITKLDGNAELVVAFEKMTTSVKPVGLRFCKSI